VLHGFLRTRTGTFTTFDVPGALTISPVSINPEGAITGSYSEANRVPHSFFVRSRDGTLTTFDPPGSIFSGSVSINSEGAITGSYYDASGVSHGSLRRADDNEKESQ
jgi:hypothetical protein